MKTILFLLYNDEDIRAFNHPGVVPLKLNQSEYFESEVFRMLEDVPEADNIGLITPSIFKKVPGITLERLFELKPDPISKLLLWLPHIPTDILGERYHGTNYTCLMLWLLEELKISTDIIGKYQGFYSNLWVAKRDFFVEYLKLAKRAITVIDNAPPHIKYLLASNPNYPGNLVRTGILEKRFGKPYYPWQPFLMERLICVYAHIVTA
jgi:hypothetical protein